MTDNTYIFDVYDQERPWERATVHVTADSFETAETHAIDVGGETVLEIQQDAQREHLHAEYQKVVVDATDPADGGE